MLEHLTAIYVLNLCFAALFSKELTKNACGIDHGNKVEFIYQLIGDLYVEKSSAIPSLCPTVTISRYVHVCCCIWRSS